jgi:Tc toxin complex TcA C-terminal TcB-binding domain/Neuraminidase-like domain
MDTSVTEKRANLVHSFFKGHDTAVISSFVAHLRSSDSEIASALTAVRDDPTITPYGETAIARLAPVAEELRITFELAAISNDDAGFVAQARSQRPSATSLRAFAIQSGKKDIAGMLARPENAATRSDKPTAQKLDATAVRRKLFMLEPTGVVMRMVKDGEIDIAQEVRTHIYDLLEEQPNFNLGASPITRLLAESSLFKQLPPDAQDAVGSDLKMLQRARALTPVPEGINPLIKKNLTSALRISSLSETAFVQRMRSEIEDLDVAKNIHRHSVESRVRNENFLISSLQNVRGTGLRVIDGVSSTANVELRKQSFNAAAQGVKSQVNLEQLFGTLDFCECGDCNSVYSAAAYFVELMEFLRHNNLSSTHSKTGARDVEGTQLEMLLKRRPDLACVELTCDNTNILIPYIDLALEVMESYVVHAPLIRAYNVHGETSSENLASPQYTNLEAYRRLRSSVYPLGLPFHFPIDTTRVFLGFLKTSRAEVLRVFQPGVAVAPTNASRQAVVAAGRAFDAEFNLITQEEYVILTHEGFWQHGNSRGPCDAAERAHRIRRRQPWEYFGYDSKEDMLNDDPSTALGLSWVKAQFLKRTGIQYVDLVDLLKTRYINPNMPTGKALTTMERLRFSYRFLQYLVLGTYRDKWRRFSRLIKFLETADKFLPLAELVQATKEIDLCAGQDSDGCGCSERKQPQHVCRCSGGDEWTRWVHTWFQRIGRIIVLESGEGPTIPLEGRVWAELQDDTGGEIPQLVTESQDSSGPTFLGNLKSDGALTDETGSARGFVTLNGGLLDMDFKPIEDSWPSHNISVYKDDSDVGSLHKRVGYLAQGKGLFYRVNSDLIQPIHWKPARDTCDITKTRLLHLDGSQLSPEEYESMARFLRLWRKLGWTMNEVDEAIVGLGKETDSTPGACQQDGSDSDGESESSSGSIAKTDINVNLIHQLVSVKKLLDITGLSLEVILTFWGDLPTHGPTSLYSKTFLTHNIVRMDPVFQPDADGNYLLSANTTISDHLPVLQTTLRLSAADIAIVRQLRQIPDTLNLQTLSALYRVSTLVRYLKVRTTQLPDILAIMQEPFTDAEITLTFFQTWKDINDSNLTFPQLNYLISGIDNVSRPLAPTPQKILTLAKTLLDRLEAIIVQNPDVTQTDVDNQTISLPDLIPLKLALVFDPVLSSSVGNLIAGVFVFTTNSPPGLRIEIPESLSAKVKYVSSTGSGAATAQLIVTGILTEDESNSIKGLSSHPLWSPAIDRIKKQGKTFYDRYLASMFPVGGDAILLAGDTLESPVTKGLYFLQYFMPFLRSRLSTTAVQQTISDTLGTDPTMTSYLLKAVKSNSNETALSILLGLKDSQGNEEVEWRGYLIPTATDTYTFSVTSDFQPSDLVLEEKPRPLPHQSEDPSNIWSTDGIPLIAGTLYDMSLAGILPGSLSWSTATSPPAAIPSSSLLPRVSSDSVREVLEALTKVMILVQGFELSVDEVAHFHDHGADFASAMDNSPLNLEKLSLGTWKRLYSYTKLRDSLPKQQKRLIDLFSWASLSGSTPAEVAFKVNEVTFWDTAQCQEILFGYHALEPANFRNEVVLLKLREALGVVKATQIAVPLLFEWAKPLSLSERFYDKLSTQAEVLKDTLRSRYNADDWEQAAKASFDTLRKDQRNALVSYLIVEPSLVATGLVNDADGLFEYFLIDCQMSSCLQTSRIKQAISTIQLYVQRCLLGLEAEIGATEDDLIDRERWEWMKRYRVWEANRKVFLYPENWIVPSLRDDKSEFFLDLESALQQQDVSLTSAAQSLKTYVYGMASVANMKVYGMFVRKNTASDSKFGIHIVARSMNPPYMWHSRDYTTDGTWSPWVKMPVDIPNYDVDDGAGNSIGSGSYVAPFLWQGNPVIFFMQMVLKHRTVDNASHLSARWEQDDDSQNQARPYWQINLGVSKFNNGKWTPKELSQASLSHLLISGGQPFPRYLAPNLARYQMIPRMVAATASTPEHIRVDVVYTENVKDAGGTATHFNDKVGYFVFVDGGLAQRAFPADGGDTLDTITSFQYVESSNTIYALQVQDESSKPPYFNSTPNVAYPTDPRSATISTMTIDASKKYTFNHTFIDPLLKQINTTNNIPAMYDDFSTLSSTANAVSANDPFGKTTLSDGSQSYNELMSPHAIYNWELGLHAPMTLIDSLLNAQQFDDALKVCHVIFDPSAVGAAGSVDNSRFWKFGPFKDLANTEAKESLEQMFLQLAMSRQTTSPEVSLWRDSPFSPHAVARTRPVAYMKWIAMKYVEILIAYGDYYFRQNSLETIPDAIQCYVLASHVFGPRAQKIPRRGKTKPETYNSLLNRWDAFGNAIVQLEVEFPFANQTSQVVGSSNGIVGFANVFGFASSLYFCIPSNPQLTQLRDTIDDRLSKIRNCMDINGVHRQLALWDPPIDPALLVAATAQGLSVDTVLNDLSGPIPNYRFPILLAKALELCSELKTLGQGLLSAKEKKDNESVGVLRAAHETVISSFALDLKTRALEEAKSALDSLVLSRDGPKYRLQFYKSLVGLTDKPPGETDSFDEIQNPTLQAPAADGQLMLIPEESTEIHKAMESQDWTTGIGFVETLAGILHMWPDTEIDVKPFGIGTGLKWGGTFLGGATGAVARGLQIQATLLSNASSNASRKATLLRVLQDRIYQANNSGRELKNIDSQIVTQRIRATTAEQETQNQKKTVDQVTEVEKFLRTKYTNEELYSWMENRTRALYNSAYNLAYDLAKRAEKSFQFERPSMAVSSFIEMGYWTSAKDGLLAGEWLYLGLKRLEAAYQESLGHDFEMTKHVSVRQWAPLALIEFRERGEFTLQLPEILFDMDCPGHYMRRIVSVSVSIPCVVGPYSGVNCTLRLQQHTMRVTPRATTKNDYPQATDGSDTERFQTTNVPISAVMLSSAQSDNGRLDAPADRYNPFEGAGCISTWSFQLPKAMHAFDYSTITDVIMTIRYTSLDGGDKLRDIASDTVADYINVIRDAGSADGEGLFTFFDIKTDFATEWYRAGFGSAPTTPAQQATVNLNKIFSRLPLFTASTPADKIIATSIAILAKGSSVTAGDVEIAEKPDRPGQEGQVVRFKPGVDIESLTGLASADEVLQLPMTSWILTVKQGSMDLRGMWMVVRYSLTGD